MVSLLGGILIITVMAGFVVGNFASVFIALVNVVDWIKRKNIFSADWILTALAFSRTGLLWVMFINWISTLFYPDVNSSPVRIIVHIVWTVTNHFSTWLATSLSIFYLLKIANFSNLVFLHLRRSVNGVVAARLLGSLALCLLNFVIFCVYELIGVKEYAGNTTWKTTVRSTVKVPEMTVLTLTNLIHCITSLTCFLLFIYSLCKHFRKMQLHGKGSQNPGTRIRVRAVQTVVSYLLLLAMYCLSMIISSWSSSRLWNELIFLISEATGIYIFQAIHVS